MAKVLVNLEELDLDTVALIEQAGASGRKLATMEMRAVVAGFLVDDDGSPLPAEEALRVAGKFRLREVRDVFDQLNATLERLQADAVPKATGQP